MKTAIIGYSGAGKSTLAKSLGELYGCPVLYLDTVHFEAGWKERGREECRAIVGDFMQTGSWVIDGNYNNFFQEKRFKEADKIIFLKFSRLRCLRQAFGRFLRLRHKVRESMAAGCEEKFDPEFIKWILLDGRSRKIRLHYQSICRQYRDKVVICRNRKDLWKAQFCLEQEWKRAAH